MEKLIREMKAATRSLLRTKGYGLTVIITLSACIAVNVAIFAIVNSVLLRPLPFPNAQQIVLMSNRYPKAGVPDQYISSSGDYYDRLKYVTALQDQSLEVGLVTGLQGSGLAGVRQPLPRVLGEAVEHPVAGSGAAGPSSRARRAPGACAAAGR